MNRRRYQEVCNVCGNYDHSSYTCSWSNGYYEASAYEQYNEQGVYQQESWSNHHSNPYNLGWDDYTYDAPQNQSFLECALEKLTKAIKESMEEEDQRLDQLTTSVENIQRHLDRIMDYRKHYQENDELQQQMDSYNGEPLVKNEVDIVEQEEREESPMSTREEEKQQHEEKQQEKEEQQPLTSMATKEQAIIINILKPLPYLLSTNQIYVYILGDIKVQGKWLRKTLIPWFHVLREGRIKIEVVHDKGTHGDGVPFNIKTHPPQHEEEQIRLAKTLKRAATWEATHEKKIYQVPSFFNLVFNPSFSLLIPILVISCLCMGNIEDNVRFRFGGRKLEFLNF